MTPMPDNRITDYTRNQQLFNQQIPVIQAILLALQDLYGKYYESLVTKTQSEWDDLMAADPTYPFTGKIIIGNEIQIIVRNLNNTQDPWRYI